MTRKIEISSIREPEFINQVADKHDVDMIAFKRSSPVTTTFLLKGEKDGLTALVYELYEGSSFLKENLDKI